MPPPCFPQSVALYRYLLREIKTKLPPEARDYYRHSARQSFVAFVDERDAGRIDQIVSRAKEDAAWIVKKYTGWEERAKLESEKRKRKEEESK